MASSRPLLILIATAAALIGAAIGLGGYTFLYARGTSYLGNDPETCGNCHVMRDVVAGWRKSPHHNAATCNDCHTPHDFLGKYVTKAMNGYHHSVAFTSGDYHEPIQARASSVAITESQCRRCHGDMAAAIDGPHRGQEGVACTSCHLSVGHPH